MGKLASELRRGVAAVHTPELAGRSDRLRLNWIVGRNTDLLCFIGAASLGYGMFYLHAGLAMDMVAVWFIWYMLLDAPHFFGTYSRTYFDREELAKRRRLLLGSIALLAVGPTILLLCLALHRAGVSGYKTPYLILVAFVSLWAYWHVVRQHYGIMSLYRRKNDDTEFLDRLLDQGVLYVGLLAPVTAFAVTNAEAREVFGFSGAYTAGSGWEHGVVIASMGGVAAAIICLAARQVQRWVKGAPLNVAKLLFLSAVIPLHMVVCYHPASSTLALLGFSASVTIFHDVQYHTIVWYYQKNRMAKAGAEKHRRHGMAARIAGSFPVYVACAIGMGITFGLLGCLFDVNPGCLPIIGSRDVMLFGNVSLNELFYGVFLGVLMHHYFVDQFIWRPGRDAKLRQDLELKGAAGTRD